MRGPLYKSFYYAFNGIGETFRRERNFKIHIIFMVAVIICGIYFQIKMHEWLICFLLFALVLSLEIVNTSIEAIVDLASPDYHPLAKTAKDCSAGAVLVSAIFAAVIGLIIFIPYIL